MNDGLASWILEFWYWGQCPPLPQRTRDTLSQAGSGACIRRVPNDLRLVGSQEIFSLVMLTSFTNPLPAKKTNLISSYKLCSTYKTHNICEISRLGKGGKTYLLNLYPNFCSPMDHPQVDKNSKIPYHHVTLDLDDISLK